MMKYPDQIKAIVRQKNLIVDAKLSLPTNSEEDPPLEMYSGFSRFVFTIKTANNGNNVFNKANVVVEDIDSIVKRTDHSLKMIYDSEIAPTVKVEDEASSPAYTVKLFDRSFKNMTPAEVLIKNPESKDGLLKTRVWLNDNLATYPKNSVAIDAIDEAIELLETGKLTGEISQPQTGSVFKIYETENKYFKEKDDSGNNRVYNISVLCDPGKKYPFSVTIMNCYAPLNVKPGGATEIVMSAAKNKTTASIVLSEKEWTNIVGRMVKTMDNFESVHASTQFNLHKKHEWKPDSTKTA